MGPGGGAGTAVRPPNQGEGRSYGMGGWGGNNNAGSPQIVSIKQPQDLLDFVIEDERLSVGKCLLFIYEMIAFASLTDHQLTNSSH